MGASRSRVCECCWRYNQPATDDRHDFARIDKLTKAILATIRSGIVRTSSLYELLLCYYYYLSTTTTTVPKAIKSQNMFLLSHCRSRGRGNTTAFLLGEPPPVFCNLVSDCKLWVVCGNRRLHAMQNAAREFPAGARLASCTTSGTLQHPLPR